MNTHEHTNTYTNTLHKHTHTYARTKRSSLSRFHAHTPPTHVYCDCCRIELVTPVTHELKEQWEVEDMRELSPLPPPSPFHPLFFCKLNTNCHYSCSRPHGCVPAAASPAVDLMFCFCPMRSSPSLCWSAAEEELEVSQRSWRHAIINVWRQVRPFVVAVDATQIQSATRGSASPFACPGLSPSLTRPRFFF